MVMTPTRKEIPVRDVRAELSLLRDLRCEFTDVSLKLPEAMPEERYYEIVNALLRMGRSHQFWIGDALREGERRFGQHYTKRLDCTGYEAPTLRNFVRVARKVESSRRRDDLSFGHHDAVAAQEPEDQTRWLQRAVQNGWSVMQLRDAITRQEEAQQEALSAPVAGFFDAPDLSNDSGNARNESRNEPTATLGDIDTLVDLRTGKPVSEEEADEHDNTQVTDTDQLAFHSLYHSYSPELREGGIIKRPVLVDGRLYVAIRYHTQSSQRKDGSLQVSGKIFCVQVTSLDWWIDSNQSPSPLASRAWEAECETGQRSEDDMRGLQVIASETPPPRSPYYVCTGENVTFRYEPVLQKSAKTAKTSHPVAESDNNATAAPVVEQDGGSTPPTHGRRATDSIPEGKWEQGVTDTVADYEATMDALADELCESCPYCGRTDCDDQCDGAQAAAQKQLLTLTDETPMLIAEVLLAFRHRMVRAVGMQAVERLLPPDQADEDPDESEVGEFWATFLHRLMQAYYDERELANMLQCKINAGVLLEGDDVKLLKKICEKEPGKVKPTPRDYLHRQIAARAIGAGVHPDCPSPSVPDKPAAPPARPAEATSAFTPGDRVWVKNQFDERERAATVQSASHGSAYVCYDDKSGGWCNEERLRRMDESEHA